VPVTGLVSWLPRGDRAITPNLTEGMETLREFFHMGGYGFYVWSAYGVAFVVLVANVVVPMWRMRDVRARLARQARLEEQS
jgi:heme exporter protein D